MRQNIVTVESTLGFVKLMQFPWDLRRPSGNLRLKYHQGRNWKWQIIMFQQKGEIYYWLARELAACSR